MWEILLLLVLAVAESQIASESQSDHEKRDRYGHGRCFAQTWAHLQKVTPIEDDPAVFPSTCPSSDKEVGVSPSNRPLCGKEIDPSLGVIVQDEDEAAQQKEPEFSTPAAHLPHRRDGSNPTPHPWPQSIQWKCPHPPCAARLSAAPTLRV